MESDSRRPINGSRHIASGICMATPLVKCEDCEFLDEEKYPKHAAVGFGQCKLDEEPGKFYSMVYMKVCEHYKGREKE